MFSKDIIASCTDKKCVFVELSLYFWVVLSNQNRVLSRSIQHKTRPKITVLIIMRMTSTQESLPVHCLLVIKDEVPYRRWEKGLMLADESHKRE